SARRAVCPGRRNRLPHLAAALFFAGSSFAKRVDFKRDVSPILEQACATCHNAAKAAGGLAVTSRKALLDKKSIVPGKPDASLLYKLAAMPAGRAGAMPPGGPRLPEDKLDVLKRWIEQGANWPAGVTLKAPGGAGDEHETVRQIHDRIRAKASGRMEPYKVTIPNTLISYAM